MEKDTTTYMKGQHYVTTDTSEDIVSSSPATWMGESVLLHERRGHLIVPILKKDASNYKEDTYITVYANLKESDNLKE